MIRDSADGPVVVISTGGPAGRMAAAIGRLFGAYPEWATKDRDLRDIRRLLLRAEGLRSQGLGFTSETERHPPVVEWATSGDMARHLGITPQAVTKRCRARRVPGAEFIDGRWWIPPDAFQTRSTDDPT